MTALDPVLQEIANGAKGRPSLYDMDPVAARAAFDARIAGRLHSRPDGLASEDLTITGEHDLPLRIYRPRDTSFGATIVFLHGGGYMLGGLDQMDAEASFLAEYLHSVVVSVDYRLAPENKLPAAMDDAVAALDWSSRNIADLGGRADRLCVAGESAGANIAATAAIEARERGIDLAAQLLIVPGPDFAALAAIDRDKDYPLLSGDALRKIAALALPSMEVADRYPYSAARAASLASLAPAVIAVAGHCPTLAIGIDYARKLEQAGNTVRMLEFGDMFHPFFAFTHASPAARRAAEVMLDTYREVIES